jgi:fermentation-respiration switch protein FrsA (DUF1100 family)
VLRWFEQSQIYHPRAAWDFEPGELGRPYEDFFLTASDGVKLSAWYFPADKTAKRKDWAITVCHGNGGNISHRLQLTTLLLKLGVNVLQFDYRGYGRSGGKLSEEGTYLDAQASYHWLREQKFAERRIVAFGESLGGAVACELASREIMGGLVLQSTFTSIAQMGAELFPWLPVRPLLSIKYDTVKTLPSVHVPVMVMHSKDDGLIRYSHAEKNFAAANEPKMFWEIRGGHNECQYLDREKIAEGMEKFLVMAEATNF